MDQTEKYLNDILKKRLGSVVNYGANSKSATTVTRLPKKQEKVQSMPTVFRKKHQTVYQQGEIPYQFQSQHYSERQRSKEGLKSKVSGELNSIQNDLANQQKKPVSNQRVEYMLISKRIQQKTEDNFISPTVDVTKYTQTSSSKQIVPSLFSKNNNNKNSEVNYTNNKNSSQFLIQQNSRTSRSMYQNEQQSHFKQNQMSKRNSKNQNNDKYEQQEQVAWKKNNKQAQFKSMKADTESLSSQALKSKRRKIFN